MESFDNSSLKRKSYVLERSDNSLSEKNHKEDNIFLYKKDDAVVKDKLYKLFTSSYAKSLKINERLNEFAEFIIIDMSNESTLGEIFKKFEENQKYTGQVGSDQSDEIKRELFIVEVILKIAALAAFNRDQLTDDEFLTEDFLKKSMEQYKSVEQDQEQQRLAQNVLDFYMLEINNKNDEDSTPEAKKSKFDESVFFTSDIRLKCLRHLLLSNKNSGEELVSLWDNYINTEGDFNLPDDYIAIVNANHFKLKIYLINKLLDEVLKKEEFIHAQQKSVVAQIEKQNKIIEEKVVKINKLLSEITTNDSLLTEEEIKKLISHHKCYLFITTWINVSYFKGCDSSQVKAFFDALLRELEKKSEISANLYFAVNHFPGSDLASYLISQKDKLMSFSLDMLCAQLKKITDENAVKQLLEMIGFDHIRKESAGDLTKFVEMLIFLDEKFKLLGWFEKHIQYESFIKEHRYNINALYTNDGVTPLYVATTAGRLDMMTMLINNGADVNLMIDGGVTLLYVATSMRNIPVIKLLIESGTNINESNGDEHADTPLNLAITMKNIEVINLLIENGASVDIITNLDGETPLFNAVLLGNVEIVKILLKNNVNLNVRNNQGATALSIAFDEGDEEIFSLLINEKIDIDYELHRAIISNNTKLVKALLEKRKNIDLNTGMTGESFLHLAIRYSCMEIVSQLIANGADVNCENRQYVSPLFSAIAHGRADIVKLLIINNCNVCKSGAFEDRSPLYYACELGDANIVSLLLEAKADVNQPNDRTLETPIYATIVSGNMNIMRMLMDVGANLNVINAQRFTPLFAAIINNQLEMIEVFLDRGANINYVLPGHYSPLNYSISRGQVAIAKLLLLDKYAPDLTISMRPSMCAPIHIAAYVGYVELVELLFKKNNTSYNILEAHAALSLDGPQGLYALASRANPQHTLMELFPRPFVFPVTMFPFSVSKFTPLFLAILGNHKDMVALLLKLGADVTAKIGNVSVIDFAKALGNKTIIELVEMKMQAPQLIIGKTQNS